MTAHELASAADLPRTGGFAVLHADPPSGRRGLARGLLSPEVSGAFEPMSREEKDR